LEGNKDDKSADVERVEFLRAGVLLISY